MQLFLSLADSDKERAERELRARADGAVHARRRATPSTTSARPPARSPASGRVERAAASAASPTTASATTPGIKRIFGRRGRFDWHDVLHLVVAPPAPRAVPGRQAVGLLRHRAARPAARARGWCAPTAAPGMRIKPVVARDPRPPGAVRGPRRARHGQVAGGVRRRRAALDGQRHRPRQLDLAARRHGPDAVPTRRRWPAGTGARRGCRRTRCAARFDAVNYLMRDAARCR